MMLIIKLNNFTLNFRKKCNKMIINYLYIYFNIFIIYISIILKYNFQNKSNGFYP